MEIGAYQVVKELARGGMGAVFLARGPDGEEVAIKLLLEGAPDPELVRRFRREAEALEALAHPGLLRVRGHGVANGRPYMVMDLLPGPTLAEVVKAEGPLPEARARALGQRMAAALAHAHARGIVHRDLKPENVILRGEEPVLVDFGLARQTGFDASRLTETGAILGSPRYMAPEQAQGDKDVGPAADVYALGATLYFLLTGKPPFDGASVLAVLARVANDPPTPPRALRPDLDPAFEALVLRCLEKDPGQRYPAAPELARALAALDGAPRPPRSGGRAVAGVALGLAVAAGLAWGGARWGAGTPPQRAQAAALVQEARAAYSRGKFEEGIALCDRAIALDPSNHEAYAGRGAGKGVLGRAAEALRDCTRALELEPGYVRGYTLRGQIQFKLRRPAEAFEDYERALALAGDGAEAAEVYTERAQLQFRLWRFEAARADCDEALRRDPECLAAYGVRAQASEGLKAFGDAIADLDAAIAKGAKTPENFALRAWSAARLGLFQDALADSARALALDPGCALAYLSRSVCEVSQGELQDALDDAERATALDPANGTAHRQLGSVLARLERPKDALQAWDRALALRPRDAELHAIRGGCRGRLGLEQQALADLARALELDPNCGMAYLNRGVLHARRERPEEAVADLTQAIALRPADPGALHALAGSLVDLERYEDAIRALDRELALSSRDPLAFLMRGHAKACLGRHAEALADLDQALALDLPAKNLEEARRWRAHSAAELAR